MLGILLLLEFSPKLMFGQKVPISHDVLNELNYFDSFLNKFLPDYHLRIYVIKIDTSYRLTNGLYYLVSPVYDSRVIPYINPSYSFKYNGIWYLIKSTISESTYKKNAIKIDPYKTDKKKIKNYLKANIGTGAMTVFFPYCFFFKSFGGKVEGGKDIGHCDPYFQSTAPNSFFYDNNDIKRVQGTKPDSAQVRGRNH